MENQVVEQVKSKVKERLYEALNAGFTKEIPNYEERERESLKLFRRILTTPGLEDRLVARIADYTIENCKYSLKTDSAMDRMPVFMRAVDQFLTSHQCLLLAEYFDKEIQKEEQETIKRR